MDVTASIADIPVDIPLSVLSTGSVLACAMVSFTASIGSGMDGTAGVTGLSGVSTFFISFVKGERTSPPATAQSVLSIIFSSGFCDPVIFFTQLSYLPLS